MSLWQFFSPHQAAPQMLRLRHSERLSFKLENLRVVLFLADSPWRMDFALLSLEVVLQNA